MTDHPAKDCTHEQRAAFEQIASGQRPKVTASILLALITKGLMIRADDEVKGSGRVVVRVPSYEVPIFVMRNGVNGARSKRLAARHE